jgi:hypothetical protein
MKCTPIAVAAVVVLISVGCRSTPDQVVKANPPGTLKLEDRIPLGVPPGSITFTGRILSIDTARSADPSDACHTAPCRAQVRIVAVTMVGVKGPTNIFDGEERQMQFPMTLQASAYNGQTLPGLKVGDTFSAMGYEVATSKGMLISVESYEKR